jgi:hypothetical protein
MNEREETRSFPARAVMMVFMAPETENEEKQSQLMHNISIRGTRTRLTGRSMVRGQLEDHLDEFASVRGQSSLEPEKGEDTSDSDLLLEDVRDPHAGVEELLASLVGDGGDEGGGLSDHAELLEKARREERRSTSDQKRVETKEAIEKKKGRTKIGSTHLSPLVVHGDERRLDLLLDGDGSVGDEGVVGLLERLRELLKGVGNDEASLFHGLVLLVGRLERRVGHRTGVSELDLGREHLGASTDGPGDDGLLDGSVLDGLDDSVLLGSTDLSEEDEHLALRVLLVSEEVVDEGRSGVSVSSNGDSLVSSVGNDGEDVVKLVGHSSGLGDVTDGSGSVELGGENVV